MGNYALYQYQVILPKNEASQAMLKEFIELANIPEYPVNLRPAIQPASIDYEFTPEIIDCEDAEWLENDFRIYADACYAPAGVDDFTHDALGSKILEVDDQYVVYIAYTAARAGMPADAGFFDTAVEDAENLKDLFEAFNPIVKYNKQSEYSEYYKGNFKVLV